MRAASSVDNTPIIEGFVRAGERPELRLLSGPYTWANGPRRLSADKCLVRSLPGGRFGFETS